MTEPLRRLVLMGVFRACPVPMAGPSAGLPKDQNPLLQGNNSEFRPIPPFCAKNRLENQCESSCLPEAPPKIPCADGTGKQFVPNRESILAKQGINSPEQGIRHKSPDAPIHVKCHLRRG